MTNIMMIRRQTICLNLKWFLPLGQHLKLLVVAGEGYGIGF